MNGQPLIEKAMALAVGAHAGQLRKDAPVPYIVHPVSVALILARRNFSDLVVAAALVHDVVEDTSVTLSDVERELGEEVAALVAPVTHDESLSWEERKKAYIEAVHAASAEAKAIATADKIANARNLLAAYDTQGPDVWKHFNAGREKKLWFENAMLDMLQKSWEHSLVSEYAALVTQMNALP